MADDPNRDLLPINEGSCIDTCRSNVTDPRERHAVCKLDRYQLEDRYLRLLEETNNLKRLSNNQEDKIKRLATKLMRVSTNPRGCITALENSNDKDRIASLELENTKLKDKICVLRNQLLNHKILKRSTSRSHPLQTGTLSGPTTYRSETGRAKTPCYQCTVRDENGDNNTQNYLVKIEELETEKKEMMSRITELESELATYMAGSQREKVAENVEYIRIWRQMKQSTEKLVAAQTTNETLKAEVHELKKLLEETTKNNKEITAALVTEKKRLVDMDEQMKKAKDSQLSLREKDEQIRDLMNEMKILQQHNNELITLSSKYGQIEVENVELKKKISKHLSDHQSLKNAFNNEQANIVALRAANEQLLKKLQELQKNMDSLTIQLVSFQNQSEKRSKITTAVQACVQCIDKKTSVSSMIEEYLEPSENLCSSQVDDCNKKCCCERLYEENITVENVVPPSCSYMDKEIQTTIESQCMANSTEILCNTKDQNMSTVSSSFCMKSFSKDELPSTHSACGESQEVQNEIPLSRKKMLQLLEQAQINTPLEAQNAARIRQIDATCDVNCSGILESNQGQSRTQEILQHDCVQSGKSADIPEHCNVSPETVKPRNPKSYDPNEILSVLYDILQEYINKCNKCCDLDNASSRKDLKNVNSKQDNRIVDYRNSTANHKYCHVNHNSKNINHKECDTSRPCSILYKMLKEKGQPEMEMPESCKTVMQDERNKFIEMEDCTCKRDQKCYVNMNCSLEYCTPRSTQNHISHNKIHSKCRCKTNLASNDKEMGNVDSGIKKKIDSIYTAQLLLPKNRINYIGNNDCNSLWQKIEGSQLTKDLLPLDEKVKISSCELDKHREFLRSQCNLNYLYKNERDSVTREVDCLNDSQVIQVSGDKSVPMLITKEQDLVEIHVLSLQLSESATQIFLRKNNMDDLSFFISWNIWGQKTAFTPILKYPRMNFNFSSIYRIPKLFEFFDCMFREHVTFQVHVMHKDESLYTIAQAELCIENILDYPQNKLYYTVPVSSVIPCSRGINFGQVSLWIRLSCDLNVIESFKNKKRLLFHLNETDTIKPHAKKPEKMDLTKSVVQPVQLQKYMKYKNFDKMNDNAKKIESSVIANTNNAVEETVNENDATKEIAKHLKRDSGEQIETLSIAEFNKVLKNDIDSCLRGSNSTLADISDVFEENNWHEYKKSLDDIILRIQKFSKVTDYADEEDVYDIAFHPIEKDVIIIEIISMTLFPRTTFINDPEVHQLYVEFSFLGYRGADMETISLPKPEIRNEPMVYNFKKNFEIDEKSHSEQRNLLRALLLNTANQNIRFKIVSEPLSEEMNIKECVEVGYADFNLKEYALGDDFEEVSLTIINSKQMEQIGILKITVLGIETIRECMTV